MALLIPLIVLAFGMPLMAAVTERSLSDAGSGLRYFAAKAYLASLACTLTSALLILVIGLLSGGLSDLGAGFDFVAAFALSVPLCFVVFPVVLNVSVSAAGTTAACRTWGAAAIASIALAAVAFLLSQGGSVTLFEVLAGVPLFVAGPVLVWRLYLVLYGF